MSWNVEEWMKKLKFDENGLIPAIVQDYRTQEVLTLAYMSRESLRITLEEKKTCFYSRSRQCLWRKGESSGTAQMVMSIALGSDGNALVLQVKKAEVDCRNGEECCFFNDLYEDDEYPFFSLDALMRSLKESHGNDRNKKEKAIYEICELVYHGLVLMVEMGISLEEVSSEMARRYPVEPKIK